MFGIHAYTPRWTLKSNNDKTVVFQGMCHGGTPEYYDTIRKVITEAKKNGFVLFYERIKKSDDNKNNIAFYNALGFNANSEEDLTDPLLMGAFIEAIGLQKQPNETFLNIIDKHDYRIDMSVDKLMELVDHDKNTKLIDVSHFRNKFKAASNSMLRSKIMKLVLKTQMFLIKSNINLMRSKKNMSIVTEARDKYLADKIMACPFKNILVLYGVAHFHGVLKHLKKQDDWVITNQKSTKVF